MVASQNVDAVVLSSARHAVTRAGRDDAEVIEARLQILDGCHQLVII
jgi:hypothetical protein